MDTTQREGQASKCPLCGELPDETVVRTGRDEPFPAAFNKLIYVSGDLFGFGGISTQNYRCPHCDTKFVCEFDTAFTGSGVNDEARIMRASVKAARDQASSPSVDPAAAAPAEAERAAAAEAAYARQAFGIMEKHFASAGVVMKHPDPPKDWPGFCSRFYLNTVEFAKRGSHTRLMAGLFAELVDLMYASSGRSISNDLYSLLVDFRHYSWLEPLLPDAARSRIGAMVEMRSDAEDEEERFRLGQMSY